MITQRYIQRDGTPRMFVSPKQEDTSLYITSRGDNTVDAVRGAGERLFINGAEDGSNFVEIQFIDDVYLKDGTFMWESAIIGDSITMEVVLPANTLFPSQTGTGNYNVSKDGVASVNSSGDGDYMMFPVDVVLNRFMNEVMIVGSNTVGYSLGSSDTAFIPKQLKTRLTVKSEENNPNIVVVVAAQIYRASTI